MAGPLDNPSIAATESATIVHDSAMIPGMMRRVSADHDHQAGCDGGADHVARSAAELPEHSPADSV